MKKDITFIWDDACQKVFDEIKEYLTLPPILVAPLGKSFLLYVRAMDRSLGALLAQKNDIGAEQAIYYLSRTMVGTENRYNSIEKECLALVFAVQKTRHYLEIFKGQALEDFLAAHPVPESSKLYEDIPDKVAESNTTSEGEEIWQLYFDGASRTDPKEKSSREWE